MEPLAPPGEPGLVIPDYDAPGPAEPGMPPPAEPGGAPPMTSENGAFDGLDMNSMGVKVSTLTLFGKRISVQALGGAAL
jgi:hypothetical protein